MNGIHLSIDKVLKHWLQDCPHTIKVDLDPIFGASHVIGRLKRKDNDPERAGYSQLLLKFNVNGISVRVGNTRWWRT